MALAPEPGPWLRPRQRCQNPYNLLVPLADLIGQLWSLSFGTVPGLQRAVPLRTSPALTPAGSVAEPVPSPSPWIPTPLPDPRRRPHGVARLK